MLKAIEQHLTSQGYACSRHNLGSRERLSVEVAIADRNIRLLLASDPPFYELPIFALADPHSYGRLAHVTIADVEESLYGVVCVNAPDSLSINFEQPLLVVEESLKRHVSLLGRCLADPEWNRRELLREFYSDWLRLCRSSNRRPLLANLEKPKLQKLSVYRPVKDSKQGIESHYMVHPSDNSFSDISDIYLSMVKGNRQIAGQAIVIPLEELTPAPTCSGSLEQWYIDTMETLPVKTRTELQQVFGQWRGVAYWIVFTAITVDDDRTWFALKLTCKSKKALPLSKSKLQSWTLEALPIRLFNQENTVQRGGGCLSLADKKVAVIGVGSVGCEIAHKLSAAGVRSLALVDPDVYEINNLYRHVLEQGWVGAPKAFALMVALQRQFPWSRARWTSDDLMKFARDVNLENFDLIVIAIGNPTQERLFKQYLLNENIDVAVLNTWLEGLGVGGHAVLDVSSSKGCLLCSYVCQESGTRGLVSNMNFIEPNQVMMKSIAGCGEQFISYGAASSAQTGVMAANLAIRFLEGKQSQSCKVSWKGSVEDAEAEGIKMTHRYYNFQHSLEYLPLFDEDCDACSYE
ncbi:ThiF family protein [Idiomarina fontislapidosi]|uniref:Thiamine biosynthesis protein ThiF n=1 Tax=Idiomarina fontislapidosi TaxID=263723 RepID=A0A432Y8P0_9GAMM|nr:ThiF family adenylyltransferase [Idiomarina fontislapidosi]PYE33905.1 ThiF family protein [Idiomarina fontislapidosi]RUO57292.1 thiamine biosynthesis protein ThiF [Idiomarina fontislapidosi]